MTDVVVIGGGLAGLINSILLNRKGHKVTLIEKKEYPFHRVCGEYISNEVIPFLKSVDLFPEEFEPAEIDKFQLTSVAGRSLELPLDLGGFGISRYTYDNWLAGIAKNEGVDIREKTTAENIRFEGIGFAVDLRGKETLNAHIVLGAFGKRSALDKNLNRQFINKSSPYIGVKYHIRTNEVASDLVALHNFEGGYCGVSRIEDQKYNLCYLSRRDTLKPYANIEEMEQEVLYQNPFLKSIYKNSEFLFEKPEVINEISFAPKEAVFDHVLMAGDAAGMITPLCGNGMAMAIHAAKISSEMVSQFLSGLIDRPTLESQYEEQWKKTFSLRHWAGRKIQGLFGGSWASSTAVNLGKLSRPTANFLMKQTHGEPF